MKKIVRIVYIAYKNIFRKKSRTIVIGSAVMLSALILLLTNSIATGVDYKILRDQIYIDSGHVSILWKDNYKFTPGSRDYEKSVQNKLVEMIQKEKGVKHIYYNNLGSVQVNISGAKESEGTLMGIDFNQEESSLKEGVKLTKGKWPESGSNQIILSEKYAEKNLLTIGSHVNISAHSIYGSVKTSDFNVCGIYKNGTPWHDSYLYVNNNSYNELFEGKHIYTRIKIFTYNKSVNISKIKSKLKSEIRTKKYPFIVKDYNEEAGPYKGFSETTRAMFNTLNGILIFIIILGIQSIVILAVNDRKKEISTMRALGFYKSDITFLLFSEYVIIAFIFGFFGIILSLGVIKIIQIIGIPLKSEVLTYLFGNNYLYPVISTSDFIITFFMIFIFVILAVLPQALKKQRVTGRNLN